MPNNLPKVDFKAKQQEFAAYIRNPKNPAPSDVKLERIDMYHQLFFNNIDGFLSGNFPVIRQILSDDVWLEMIRDFFARHHCTTPYFVEIPEEFMDYLQNERDTRNDYPFLLELAHYEWVEMALSVAKEELLESNTDFTDLVKKNVQLSPVAWPLAYSFPVHKISPDFLPAIPPDQPTFLVVYRNQQDDVQFTEVTPVTYQLLALIQNSNGIRVTDCLQQLTQQLPMFQPELLLQNGLQVIKELAEKRVLVVLA